MDKDHIKEVARKNAVSIACGAVAVVAVALMFYPLNGMKSDLELKATNQAGDYDSLSKLIVNRKFPPLDPMKEPDPFTLFPTADVRKQAEAALAALELQSNQIIDELVKNNNHTDRLLVSNVLPGPGSTTSYLNFGKKYLKIYSVDPAMTGRSINGAQPDKDLTDPSVGPPADNLYNDVLHGGQPPTAAEVEARRKSVWESDFVVRFQYQNGQVTNLPAVKTAFAAVSAKIPQDLRNSVALTRKMYVDVNALLPNGDVKADVPPTDVSTFYAQMSLWVQQDLCAGLAKADDGRKNVVDARVKRLLWLRLPPPPPSPDKYFVFPPATGGGPGAPGVPGAGDKPAAETEAGKLPKVYAVGPTGRVSNGMYDVIPFRMMIDVDATQVPAVINALCDSKMIYITNVVGEHWLDTEAELAKGYVYGTAPVVRLQLEGEALFMRKWTTPLMPALIKAPMGLGPAGANGQQTPGGGQFGRP